ncbi:MAG: hypothetical protein AAGD25_13695 [Cyanobacteria bacterium P01_F01_bin.150]
MNQNLVALTNAELKRYISEHRNDSQAFSEAMDVLMSRRNNANRHPYPFDRHNPEAEVEAILRQKLNEVE